MINGVKDSPLVKNKRSPSAILTAVLEKKTKKSNLQGKNFKQCLGVRIKKYSDLKKSTEKTVACTVENSTAGENAKIKSFIILGNGQGVLSKRTEVMLCKNKSEGSRNGRSSSPFEQKVSIKRSADKYSITAGFNSMNMKNVLKYARYVVGIFSILRKGHGSHGYSSTGGGGSRGFTAAHKVDSEAKYMSGIKLQCKSEDRSVFSAVKAMQYSLCYICRLRYLSGTAVWLVVTCSHATARIILLIIMLNALVCRFYIYCISVFLSVTFYSWPKSLRCPIICSRRRKLTGL